MFKGFFRKVPVSIQRLDLRPKRDPKEIHWDWPKPPTVAKGGR